MPSRHFSKLSEFRTITAILALAALTACGAGSKDTPPPITDFDIDLKRRVTVSGVSAGGFMAVQSHIALAEKIGGAGIVARAICIASFQ